ncbi:hypothetical protein MAPG_06875 [Magnaporthiopsis poae ATCC 64411]|uniref:Uncharacterized protein n=1 Tax=Magnaporthiopsis poae (strain ATCC 64411 / 73-15) TaxID=644358 RepID=A0A0C4E383_MAGP6|nr:hypothetical protein MAPG_06875 [Magnaporthiopsis poae ATCC 64411]
MDRGALRCVLPLPAPRPTTAHPKAPWRGTPAAAGLSFEQGPAFPQGSSTQTSASSNLLPSLFSVSTVRRGRIGDQFPQSKSNMAETDWQIRPILQLAPHARRAVLRELLRGLWARQPRHELPWSI